MSEMEKKENALVTFKQNIHIYTYVYTYMCVCIYIIYNIYKYML